MRARIDLLSPPFAGHLHPILGMAQVLRSEHDVRVVTTPTAANRVQAAGFEAVPILADWEDRLDSIINTTVAAGSNPLRLFKQMSRALEIHQQVRVELERLYRTSRPELMIADFTLIAIGPVATALGIPWMTSLPSPCVLDGGDGPPCYLGGLRPMDDWPGKLRDRLGKGSIRGFKYLAAWSFRKDLRRIGFTSVYRQDGSETVYSNETILALGWRELEFRSRWPSSIRFIPPFLYTPPVKHESPRFAEGKKHVLVTLGTHLGRIKDRVASEIEQLAASTPGVEYHFSNGDLAHNQHDDRGHFQRLSYIDYQLIGRYDLVVHHGGAGVMAHCLSQGRRAVVYPIDFDQFDNAARLEHAGLAVRIRRLEQLPRAIESSLADLNMQERCRRFAQAHNSGEAAEKLRAVVATTLRI